MALNFGFELRDDGKVEIFDRDDGEVAVILTTEQAWAFYRWWKDGLCPECASDINVGEIVCDDCYDAATRYRKTH